MEGNQLNRVRTPAVIAIASATVGAIAAWIAFGPYPDGMKDYLVMLPPLWITSSLMLASFVIALGAGVIVSRRKGYSRLFVAIVAIVAVLVFIVMHSPGVVLISLLIILLPRANSCRTNVSVGILASFVVIGSFLALHMFGYRVFGMPYMPRYAPPPDEGWIQVLDIRPECEFVLADGSQISLAPYRFKEYLRSLSQQELFDSLFNVTPEELFVRKSLRADGQTHWIVRGGNRFYCALPGYFPTRVREAYIEEELIECLLTWNLASPSIEIPPEPPTE